MRKLLTGILVLAFMLVIGIAQAGPVKTTLVDTTISNGASEATSNPLNIQNYDKAAFFINYDETEAGNTISGKIVLEISYDGTNWFTGEFYDYAGGSTLQSSETLTTDGQYYFWIDKANCIPQVKVGVHALETDATNLLEIEAYCVGVK